MKKYIVTYFIEKDMTNVISTAPTINKHYINISSSQTDELPKKDDTIYIDGKCFFDVKRIIRFDSEPMVDGSIPVAILGAIQIDIDDELEMIHKMVRVKK